MSRRETSTLAASASTSPIWPAAVAGNLLELVAIDREIAPGAQLLLATRKRPQHGEDRHRGHQREQEPQDHDTNRRRDIYIPVAVPEADRDVPPKQGFGFTSRMPTRATDNSCYLRDIGKRAVHQNMGVSAA
jgi:hypothetical protein